MAELPPGLELSARAVIRAVVRRVLDIAWDSLHSFDAIADNKWSVHVCSLRLFPLLSVLLDLLFVTVFRSTLHHLDQLYVMCLHIYRFVSCDCAMYRVKKVQQLPAVDGWDAGPAPAERLLSELKVL